MPLTPPPGPAVHVHGDPNSLHDEAGLVQFVHSGAPFGVETGTFVLFDGEERLVASSACPRALSKYAFANGAHAVKHDYDLKLAEPK